MYHLKAKLVLVDSQDVEGAKKSISDAICCELSLEKSEWESGESFKWHIEGTLKRYQGGVKNRNRKRWVHT